MRYHVFHKAITSSLSSHHLASGKLCQIHQLVKSLIAKPLQVVWLLQRKMVELKYLLLSNIKIPL